MTVFACDGGVASADVICHPAASEGRVGSPGGLRRDVFGKYTKSRACRQQARAGKTHTPSAKLAGSPLLSHLCFTHALSPFTPPPPPYSAVVDLRSSRWSMGLRGDQARLHTSSVNRRSTRALKPSRTFCFAIFHRLAATFFFSRPVRNATYLETLVCRFYIQRPSAEAKWKNNNENKKTSTVKLSNNLIARLTKSQKT